MNKKEKIKMTKEKKVLSTTAQEFAQKIAELLKETFVGITEQKDEKIIFRLAGGKEFEIIVSE